MARNTTLRWQKAAVCLLFTSLFGVRSFAQLLGTPAVAVPPLGISVQNGGTAVFTVIDYPDLSGVNFQWYFQGKPISKGVVNGTTNGLVGGILLDLAPVSILTVTNINSANAGSYTVKSYNGSGSVTNTVTLIVAADVVNNVIDFATSASKMTTGGFSLQLSTPAGSNVVVEASSDLRTWTPIYTNLNSTGSVSFSDTGATNYSCRYYRARTQ